MKKTLGVILTACLLLLAASLGLKEITEKNQEKERIWLMETLLPGGKNFEAVPYTDENGIIRAVYQCDAGFVMETVTQGYAQEIVMLIGVDKTGAVTGLVTAEAYETLGLGSKILTDHKFLSQFLNKTGSVSVGSGQDAVDGISGATVSSKAVARCVNAAVGYVTGADGESSATTWGG